MLNVVNGNELIEGGEVTRVVDFLKATGKGLVVFTGHADLLWCIRCELAMCYGAGNSERGVRLPDAIVCAHSDEAVNCD